MTDHPEADQPPTSEVFVDLYKLAVEMADRISARKLVANSFFLTLNAGLVALLGSLHFPWYVSAAGFLLAVVWWALLNSYRDLNRAKFAVINAMEKRLPAQIYTDEWAELKPTRESARWYTTLWRSVRGYRELGFAERAVPLLFALFFGLAAILHR